jgi:hypothetical protein
MSAIPRSISIDDPRLRTPVEEMMLTIRAQQTLLTNDILYAGEAVRLTTASYLAMKNSGRRQLNETARVLADMGLGFGMRITPEPGSKTAFRKLLSSEPQDATEGNTLLFIGLSPADETDAELRKELLHLFRQSREELADAGSMPEAVKKRMLGALRAARKDEPKI